METVTLWWTGAYIINTFLNVIKPLIPEAQKKYIPVLALLMWVLYGVLFIEGSLEAKIAWWLSIGSISIAWHEGSKMFAKEKDLSELQAYHG